MQNIVHRENTAGTDYFVGDLHGSFSELLSAIDERHFDPSVDRLFSVGDLIDRGNQSLECLRLISEPWFFAVLGNHEEMFRDVLVRKVPDRQSASRLHEQNGGAWAAQLDEDEEAECLELINSLPLCRTIAYGPNTIGIVHAGWCWEWAAFAAEVVPRRLQLEYATWSRLDAYGARDKVPGIDVVVSGHQNTAEIIKRGNQFWIDTIGQTGKLTLLDCRQVIDLLENNAE